MVALSYKLTLVRCAGCMIVICFIAVVTMLVVILFGVLTVMCMRI